MPSHARFNSRFLLAALPVFFLFVAASSFAQAPTPDGRPRRYGDPFTASRRDSVVRTLEGPRQLWTHAGFGWLAAPSEVRHRYSAGLDVGISGDRRFSNRLALRGRFDFADLPSSKPDAVVINGVAYATNIDYGHGWTLASSAGGALRVWNGLWIEGEAGGGYFNSGFGDSDDYVDIATGQSVKLRGRSGWGPLWSTGARYEFQPGRRDRLLAEFRYGSMERAGTTLEFFSIRAGYRVF